MPVVITGPGTAYVSTTGTTTTWQGWNQAWHPVSTTSGATTLSASTSWTSWNAIYTGHQESEPQYAERQERGRQAAVDRKEARRRAEELLLALLSDEQAVTWREHDWFTVRGSASGDVYRIRRGTVNNVDRMSGDEVDMIFCAHPPEVPAEDANLAQMFLLATDEDAFLAVANSHRVQRERQPVLRVVA